MASIGQPSMLRLWQVPNPRCSACAVGSTAGGQPASARRPPRGPVELHTAVLGTVAAGVKLRIQRHLQARRRHSRELRQGCRATDKGSSEAQSVPPELGEWCALFINLDRRADRKERLRSLLAEANAPLLRRLERVEAIDKLALSLDDEVVVDAVGPYALERARRALDEEHYTIVHDEEGNLVHFDDHLTVGGIACALSHRLALQRIATHPTAEWGLILEDDVNAVVPRVDLAISKLLKELPEHWDAVCLAYHDPRGRVHPLAVDKGPVDESFDGAEVELIQSHGHVFGLGAWMVRKEAAQELVEHAFPIESQVDFTLTNWLARNGRSFWKVDPTNLLFYAPSSEEEMDSDVQTMVPIAKIEEEHESLQAYIDYMNGRTADPYEDWDLDLDLDYGAQQFDEEEWIRQWQEARYEEYYGRSRSEG
eukprot:s735_g10.t1